MTCTVIQLCSASFGVDGEEIVQAGHDAYRDHVLGVQLDCFDELSPRMAPTHSVNDLRSADMIVSRIAVGLQDAIELLEKLLRSVAPASQAEVERNITSRSSVLPEVGLMILATAIVHLHIYRGLISLDITSTQ